jgi:rSAM/selenodomain-associated transferase 1
VSVSAVPLGREECVVLVVAKAPVAGRAKTRLAASIGAFEAAELARAMLLDTLDGCRREVPLVGVLCASVEDAELLAELVEPGEPVVVQEGQGLGAALGTGVRRALAHGDAALLVSSDIPGVPPDALRDAVALLRDGVDVVLGPGHDGGYWLIGLREEHTDVFEGIPWSTDAVLEATLARCDELALAVRLVSPWRDVDTMDDVTELARTADTLPGHRSAAAVARLRENIQPTQEVHAR